MWVPFTEEPVSLIAQIAIILAWFAPYGVALALRQATRIATVVFVLQGIILWWMSSAKLGSVLILPAQITVLTVLAWGATVFIAAVYKSGER